MESKTLTAKEIIKRQRAETQEITEQTNSTTKILEKTYSYTLTTGTKLPNGFIVQDKLDQFLGGESTYYSCRKEKDPTAYVLKIYNNIYLDHEELNNRLAKLKGHEKYLRLPIETNKLADGPHYEIYTFLKKGSLVDQMSNLEDIHIRELIIPQINEALHLLHQNGIIHGDVKPDNVYLNDEGKFILGDFGASVCFKLEKDASYSVKTKPIRKQTLGFTAPEVVINRTIDPSSDYYSFAKTIIDLYMNGKWISTQDGQIEFNQSLYEKKDLIPSEIPEDIKDLIVSLMKSSPKDRIGYEKVKLWISNPKILAGAYARQTYSKTIPLSIPFMFANASYDDLLVLINAMMDVPNLAKKVIQKDEFKALFQVLTLEMQEQINNAYNSLSKIENLLSALEQIIISPDHFRCNGVLYEKFEEYLMNVSNNFSIAQSLVEEQFLVGLRLKKQAKSAVVHSFIEKLLLLSNPVRFFDLVITIFYSDKFHWDGKSYLSCNEFLSTLYQNGFSVHPLHKEDERILFEMLRYESQASDHSTIIEIEKIINNEERYFKLIYLEGNQEDNDFCFNIEGQDIKTLRDLVHLLGYMGNQNTKMHQISQKVFDFILSESFELFLRASKYVENDQLKIMLRRIQEVKKMEDKEYAKAYLWFQLEPNNPLILNGTSIGNIDELINYFSDDLKAEKLDTVIHELNNSIVRAFCHSRGIWNFLTK